MQQLSPQNPLAPLQIHTLQGNATHHQTIAVAIGSEIVVMIQHGADERTLLLEANMREEENEV